MMQAWLYLGFERINFRFDLSPIFVVSDQSNCVSEFLLQLGTRRHWKPQNGSSQALKRHKLVKYLKSDLNNHLILRCFCPCISVKIYPRPPITPKL